AYRLCSRWRGYGYNLLTFGMPLLCMPRRPAVCGPSDFVNRPQLITSPRCQEPVRHVRDAVAEADGRDGSRPAVGRGIARINRAQVDERRRRVTDACAQGLVLLRRPCRGVRRQQWLVGRVMAFRRTLQIGAA